MSMRLNFSKMMATAYAALTGLVGANPQAKIEAQGSLRKLPLSVRMAAQANANRHSRSRGTSGAHGGTRRCGGYHARQAVRLADREGRGKYLVPAKANPSLVVPEFQSRQTGGQSRAARVRRSMQEFKQAAQAYINGKTTPVEVM